VIEQSTSQDQTDEYAAEKDSSEDHLENEGQRDKSGVDIDESEERKGKSEIKASDAKGDQGKTNGTNVKLKGRKVTNLMLKGTDVATIPRIKNITVKKTNLRVREESEEKMEVKSKIFLIEEGKPYAEANQGKVEGHKFDDKGKGDKRQFVGNKVDATGDKVGDESNNCTASETEECKSEDEENIPEARLDKRKREEELAEREAELNKSEDKLRKLEV
jgi:hypothetical protein